MGFQNTDDDDDKPKKKKNASSQIDEINVKSELLNSAVQELYSYVKIDSANRNVRFNGLDTGSLGLVEDESAIDWSKDIVSINKPLQVAKDTVLSGVRAGAVKTSSLNTGAVKSKSITNSANITTKTLTASTSGNIKSLTSTNFTTKNANVKSLKVNSLNGDDLKTKKLNSNSIKTNSIDTEEINSNTLTSTNITSNGLLKANDFTGSSVKTKTLDSVDINGSNITTNNLKSNILKSTNIDVDDLNSKNMSTTLVKSKDIRTSTLSSDDLNTSNISTKNLTSADVSATNKLCVGNSCFNEDDLRKAVSQERATAAIKAQNDNQVQMPPPNMTTTNNIRMGKELSETVNTPQIINDDNKSKSLLLVGPKNANNEDRSVSILDRLNIAGKFCVGGSCLDEEKINSVLGNQKNIDKLRNDFTQSELSLKKIQSDFLNDGTKTNLDKTINDLKETKDILQNTQNDMRATKDIISNTQNDMKSTITNLQNDLKSTNNNLESNINSLNNKNTFDNDITIRKNLIYGVDGKSRLASDGSITSKNLNVDGDLFINGPMSKIGPPGNKFTLHTPPDNRKGLWIAPSVNDGDTDWAWDRSLNLNRNGEHSLGGNLNMAGELRATKNIVANGNIIANRDINLPNSTTIAGNQRLHISTGEILYLLPKNGVQIGREWGGTGDLNVQGNFSVGGEIRGAIANDQENGVKLPYGVWMRTRDTGNGQDPYKLLFENSGKTVMRSPNGFEFRDGSDKVAGYLTKDGTLNINKINLGGIILENRGGRLYTDRMSANEVFIPKCGSVQWQNNEQNGTTNFIAGCADGQGGHGKFMSAHSYRNGGHERGWWGWS